MKRIVQIAKTELSALFYSPIAWLLLIVFFIQSANTYLAFLEYLITLQELGGAYREQLTFLTARMFAYPVGMTPGIVDSLYLYLPLLTMGLISREVSSGTIRLLYSSPLTTGDIVFGKYASIAVYSLMLTVVYGIFFLVGTFHLEGADTGLMLSIMLGVFLLLCAYGAIGLFVSSLTSYQVVAAISTFVLFAFLNYIGRVWQDVDFVRDITYAVSLSGRINNMSSGLITTKDIFYFISIIYIFLGLTILRLQAGRSTDSGMFKAFKYSSVVLSGIIIGFVSSRPTLTGYLDATETKTNTLTATSQKILNEMKASPLDVTSYINLLDGFFWYGMPSSRNADLERWLPYIRFKPDLQLKYVYYYDSIKEPSFYKQYPGKSLDEIAKTFTQSHRLNPDLFLKPGEIHKEIDLKPENNQYVIQVKYGDKETFLRLFNDPMVFPTERETGAGLKRLITKLPVIGFLEGELERSPYRAGDRDYRRMTGEKALRYAMINQGFDFKTVSLRDSALPSDLSVLVVADPRAVFDTAVLSKLKKYTDEGGSLLIAAEPGKQTVVNPLLEHLGVRMLPGQLVSKSEDFSPAVVFTYLTKTAAQLSKTMERAFRDSNLVGMPGVTGLIYDSLGGYTVRPLLMSDERKTWRKEGELSSDSLQISFNAAEGDEKGKFATMLALTRSLQDGKEQRIIVSSDADFMSSAELGRYQPETANFMFNTALFGWLSQGEFPVDVSRPDAKDTVILAKGQQVPFFRMLFVWIIPALIAIAAAILLIRRKKK